MLPLCRNGFGSGLIRRSRGHRLPEMVAVENRIEDQVVTSNGLSAIGRIIREQQNIARSQMSVHHDSALGNRAGFVQKPGEQQRLLLEGFYVISVGTRDKRYQVPGERKRRCQR